MIYESIIPGLNLMAIGMLIVFTFLLVLIISTKLMTLILSIGNIHTSNDIQTSLSDEESFIIKEVIKYHRS
tara:strand:- start:131 stop:343 length:213 start_codon:yes stop_codon:yes gene_type:complete